MGFECSNIQFWLDIASDNRLVITPHGGSTLLVGTIEVWVEHAVYSRLDNDPVWNKVVESQLSLPNDLPYSSTLASALACGELVGKAAREIVYEIFWRHFVERPDGLAYLEKFASTNQYQYYLGCHLELRAQRHDAVNVIWQVAKWIATPRGITQLPNDKLQQVRKAMSRSESDVTFADAIRSLAASGDGWEFRAVQFMTQQSEE